MSVSPVTNRERIWFGGVRTHDDVRPFTCMAGFNQCWGFFGFRGGEQTRRINLCTKRNQVFSDAQKNALVRLLKVSQKAWLQFSIACFQFVLNVLVFVEEAAAHLSRMVYYVIQLNSIQFNSFQFNTKHPQAHLLSLVSCSEAAVQRREGLNQQHSYAE